MEAQSSNVLAEFEASGVIISDDKKENDTKVTVSIDSKMVHLKATNNKSRFDRMIPIRQVASCEVHRKPNTFLKWALRIIGLIMFIGGFGDHTNWAIIGIGAVLFIISFFIYDSFYVEISASNGKPIKCKFDAKDKNDDVNDRFVSIVRKLICEVQ